MNTLTQNYKLFILLAALFGATEKIAVAAEEDNTENIEIICDTFDAIDVPFSEAPRPYLVRTAGFATILGGLASIIWNFRGGLPKEDRSVGLSIGAGSMLIATAGLFTVIGAHEKLAKQKRRKRYKFLSEEVDAIERYLQEQNSAEEHPLKNRELFKYYEVCDPKNICLLRKLEAVKMLRLLDVHKERIIGTVEKALTSELQNEKRERLPEILQKKKKEVDKIIIAELKKIEQEEKSARNQ